MAEIHGKSAVLYLGSGGAVAVPLGEQIDWSIDMDEAFVDSTPLGNTWKQFVKGLMGYTMTFGGNFDTANTQLFGAATSAVAENWYLYPIGASDMTKYYYGTAWIQLVKVAAGSTTTKASNSFKGTGQGSLNTH